MDHRAAQILGVGRAGGVPPGDVVGDAIVADQLGVIDRKVGGALLEIADRIAARLHHFAEQLVGRADCRAGIVDELALHRDPTVGKAVDLVAAQRTDVQGLDALFALTQLGLRLAGASRLVDGGDVLRAVLRAHLLGLAALRVDDPTPDEQQHDDGQSDCERGGVHGGILRRSRLRPSLQPRPNERP